MSFRIKLALLCILAIVAVVFINEINLNYLEGAYPSQNGMITTADEASYFAPARNFLKTGEWKDSQIGLSAYFTRPPGYGIFYLLAEIIYPSNPYFIVKAFQILGFGLSIWFFGLLLQLFNISERTNLVFTALFALLPCYSGFVYYTLSESLTMLFMLSSIYFSFVSLKFNGKYTFPAFLLIGFTTILRPQMLFVLVPVSIYMLIKINPLKRKYVIFAILPFLLWNVRNSTIPNDFAGFHPIFHESNGGLFRPPHEALTDLFRVFETDGAKFHAISYSLAYDQKDGLKKSLKVIPEKYHRELIPLLKLYQKAALSVYSQKEVPTKLTSEEHQFLEAVKSDLPAIKQNHAFDNYLKTPFESGLKLFKTSMMNLYIFQAPFAETFWVKILKIGSFLLINLGLLASIVLYFRRIDLFFKIVIAGIHITLFYLIYFQRMNEERYIYPMLPFLLLSLAILLKKKPLTTANGL